MASVRVRLSISSDDYLAVYRGSARSVQARTPDGQVVRFPASVLRPFVLRDGVNGEFIIEFDEAHRFKSIRRVGSAG